ncbi:MAG: hypothetical protein JXQ84_07930 [Rhodospirillaceae bacterium]|nr:hypothetical protein [Rhodospirillaceae bacterium]
MTNTESLLAMDDPAEPVRSVRFKGEEIAVPDAFWDGDANCPNVGALVKSHADLRRKVSEQRPAAPEVYALTLPEDLAQRIAPDESDPLAHQAMDWAKKHGLGQEAFSELTTLYYGALAENAVDREAELGRLTEALGPRAEAEMAGLSQWVDGMLGDAVAKTPDLFHALENLTATAEGVLLLKAFKDKLTESGVPSSRSGGGKRLDAASLRALQESDAYRAGDAATRRVVEDGWARLFPNDTKR